MVCFAMPALGCTDLVAKAVLSLIASMPEGYSFGLFVVAGDPNDGTIEWCKRNGIACYGNHLPKEEWPWQTTGLCKHTYDAAIWKMFGKFDGNKFERESDFGYMCWLHTDMLFPQKGWIGKLVEIYDRVPDVGILGPFTDQYFGATQEFKEGNVAPFMISTKILTRHYKKHGWFNPPEMYFCVDYDDWDMHQRFIHLDPPTRSLVARDVEVLHPMMGTRERLYKGNRSARDTAARENKSYYTNTHKTINDPWNSQKL
jgi:hypothetical protein